MRQQVIIGIGHYSRVGKDTLANAILVDLTLSGVRCEKRSFAKKLKEACALIYGWAGVMDAEHYDDYPEHRDVRLPLLANEQWPAGPTVVELWIAFGTPAIRQNVHDLTWVMATLNEEFGDVLIIPDVRFHNEIEALKKRNAILVKVVRPGVEPRPTSVADNALNDFDGWHMVVDNDTEDRARIYAATRAIAREVKERLWYAK